MTENKKPESATYPYTGVPPHFFKTIFSEDAQQPTHPQAQLGKAVEGCDALNRLIQKRQPTP